MTTATGLIQGWAERFSAWRDAVRYRRLQISFDRYWDRERSACGRLLNDIKDEARMAVWRLRGLSTPEEDAYDRAEKAEWRAHYKATGELSTAYERQVGGWTT